MSSWVEPAMLKKTGKLNMNITYARHSPLAGIPMLEVVEERAKEESGERRGRSFTLCGEQKGLTRVDASATHPSRRN